MEKQLELNLKGISTQVELDKKRKKEMDEISNDALDKLYCVLDNIVMNRKYNKKDMKKIISLSKWINEKK
jgi:hypothetical protein